MIILVGCDDNGNSDGDGDSVSGNGKIFFLFTVL